MCTPWCWLLVAPREPVLAQAAPHSCAQWDAPPGWDMHSSGRRGTMLWGCWVLLCDLSIKVQLSTPSAKSYLFAPPQCTAGE